MFPVGLYFIVCVFALNKGNVGCLFVVVVLHVFVCSCVPYLVTCRASALQKKAEKTQQTNPVRVEGSVRPMLFLFVVLFVSVLGSVPVLPPVTV